MQIIKHQPLSVLNYYYAPLFLAMMEQFAVSDSAAAAVKRKRHTHSPEVIRGVSRWHAKWALNPLS